MKFIPLLLFANVVFAADRADFEPFLIQAKEKFAGGDYQESISICEEMLSRDPAYAEAKECVAKGKKALLEQKRKPAAASEPKPKLDDRLDSEIQKKIDPR